MTPDLTQNIVEHFGLLGIMIVALGYMVWELLKERRRSEKRLDDIHGRYISDTENLHEKYGERLQEGYNEYRREIREINREFLAAMNRLTHSVNDIGGKVNTVLADVADLKRKVFQRHMDNSDSESLDRPD